jgi:AcrR family transcriptional regulator
MERMGRGDGYHKENLRRDLVQAGLAFVTEHGHVSLSVRTLAQQVGVSPGAPYHHFPDRRSLLHAIAVEGFKALIGRASEIAEVEPKGVDRLIALGMSFVEFTEARPRLTELMYESELTSPQQDAELEKFQTIGQSIIREAIRSALPQIDAKALEIRAVTFWSAVYGFAALRRKQNVQSFDEFDMDPEDVSRSVIGQAAATATQA